jgi:phenylpropionate dioxygenase-like ring-hydroxylating dioxygenase large terminal subunit
MSDSLKPGDVRRAKFFGKDLVIFRSRSGTLGVLDAYCRHLGAHMGYGKVVGEALQCPWHGWEWNAQGENTRIPYVENRLCTQKVGAWHSREIDGFLLAWYDSEGRDPFWEWPGIEEFRDRKNFYPAYPHGYKEIGIRQVMPQSPFENMADSHHFPYVHGAGSSGRFGRFEINGHHILGEFFVLFGKDKGPTWMTPNGPAEGLIRSEYWGLGIGLAHFTLEDRKTAHVVCVTPVDMETSMLFSTVASYRIPGDEGDVPTGPSARMIEAQHAQIESDFVIWENQKYVSTPIFMGNEEQYYKKVRDFARQFYPASIHKA